MRLATPSAARTRRTTSRPEPSGRPTSRMATSGYFVSRARSASDAQSTTSSSDPSAVSSSARNVRVVASSSATRMVAGVSWFMSLLGRGVAELAPLGPHKGARADTANLLGTAPQIGPAFHMCRERTDCKIHPMTCGSEGIGHTMPTTSEAAVHLGATRLTRHMNDARRGNYDSGEDFVLEYGE